MALARCHRQSSGKEKAGKNWPVLFHIRVVAEECCLRPCPLPCPLPRPLPCPLPCQLCLLFFSNIFLRMFLRLLFTFAIFCRVACDPPERLQPPQADSDPAAGMRLSRDADWHSFGSRVMSGCHYAFTFGAVVADLLGRRRGCARAARQKKVTGSGEEFDQ